MMSSRDSVVGSRTDHSDDQSVPDVHDNHAEATNDLDPEDVESVRSEQHKKRKKTSSVWTEFRVVQMADGTEKGECIHCKTQLKINATKSTTQFQRHLKTCGRRQVDEKQETVVNFQATEGCSATDDEYTFETGSKDGRLDMRKMRQAAATWIMMHGHAFSVVEEEGFNLMLRRGMPQWENISRDVIKKECMNIYGIEKVKNQKIKYMAVTANYIDSDWKLQKRLLSFVRLPAPGRGAEIADCIFRCLKEWEIESKVFTIMVDNTASGDAAIKHLKQGLSGQKTLLCGGKLFYQRCCAHMLNLMVQGGLSRLGDIINDVRETVMFVDRSEARLKSFTEIAQQAGLTEKKPVLDCKTRWNSTYEMLKCALKFRHVFPAHEHCPDWEKVSRVCDVLAVFSDAASIMSASEYPPSNLFLNELHRVKVLLDMKASDDDSIQKMVAEMKVKFDKYWGECNLMMAIAAILDPRCKMLAIEFCFSKMFTQGEATAHIADIRHHLYEIYQEYRREGETEAHGHPQSQGPGWCEFRRYARTVHVTLPHQSELDVYFAEGCYIVNEEDDDVGSNFDALQWWKGNAAKYRILSRIARDILAVPIASVSSDRTFTAGTRLIDSYCASLSPSTIRSLLCGGDWLRNFHRVIRKKH